MTARVRLALASGGVLALFLSVQLGALALVDPLIEADRQVVDDPDDPGVSLVFFLAILIATGAMLAAFRYDRDWAVRGLIIAVSGGLSWFVFTEVVPPAVALVTGNDLAVIAALGVVAGLVLHPEWYVIDFACVVMGAGAAALFGISIGLFPVLVFLVVLAVYDAISVYRTKHMLSLAEGVMDLRIPVVFVVPTSPSFSYRDMEETPTDPDGREEPRDAVFVGLGDAVIPTILVASAVAFLEVPTHSLGAITVTLPALGAMVGTVVGLAILLVLVFRGRPHAGLPLLNGFAIAGYLLTAVASGLSLSTALGL